MARPALYSTYALATELGRDPRMLSKALASTPPDGTGHKKAPAWKMTTALQAVAAYDANRVEVPVNINGNGARANGDAALDRICDEVEKAAAELEAVFDELASIKNLEQRRARQANWWGHRKIPRRPGGVGFSADAGNGRIDRAISPRSDDRRRESVSRHLQMGDRPGALISRSNVYLLVGRFQYRCYIEGLSRKVREGLNELRLKTTCFTDWVGGTGLTLVRQCPRS